MRAFARHAHHLERPRKLHRRQNGALITLLFVLAQPAAHSQGKKLSTEDDAKIWGEARGWFKKGEALIGTPKENSDEQAAFFRKALEIKPDFIEAHYNLALIYANQKKMKEAAAEFEKVLKLDPKFEGVHFLLASAYKSLGDSGAAIAALDAGKNPSEIGSAAVACARA